LWLLVVVVQEVVGLRLVVTQTVEVGALLLMLIVFLSRRVLHMQLLWAPEVRLVVLAEDVVHLIQPQLRLAVGKLIGLVVQAVLVVLLLLALEALAVLVAETLDTPTRVLAVAVLAVMLVLAVLAQTHIAVLEARVLGVAAVVVLV